MSTAIAVILISSLAAVLAALLVLAERYVVNYGPCEVNINDDEKTFTVNGGGPLLSALTNEKVFIPSACGGRGTCAYCKVKVLDGAGPVSPTEKPFLSKEELDQGVRLSCQVKIRENIRIEIPSQLLAVKEYRCTVESITDLTYDIKRFRFRLTDPPAIDFIPGQYVQLFTPRYKGNTEEVYRAYSIASDPADKTAIDLIIRRVPNGTCTTYCFDHLREGDKAKFNGPYGEFYLRDTDAEIIFVAGGSGMAPIECLLHHMRNRHIDRKATYFFGGNTPKDLFMGDEMKQFEADLPNFRYVPVVARPAEGDGWDGETGLVTEALGRTFDDASGAEAYLCGSPGMIDASVEVLKTLGVPEEKIYYDKFS